jgi:hypothetical protein
MVEHGAAARSGPSQQNARMNMQDGGDALGGVVCGPSAKRIEEQLKAMKSMAPKQYFNEERCISGSLQPRFN